MPPSDSRLKVTMSPCLRLTSSTQSFGSDTMRVEYPTFWTFRASIMRDIVYIFYTKQEKKDGYIRELLGMLFLYLAEEIYVSARLPIYERLSLTSSIACVEGSACGCRGV